jgi:hypothetical protein
MSDILPIKQLMRRNKIAQNASGTIFSRGALLWYPPFSTTRIVEGVFALRRYWRISRSGRRCGRCRPCGRKETRPQGTSKTAQPAVFHSAHTAPVFLYKKKRNNEERCKCANLIVSTEGFTPGNCAPDCALTGVYPRQTPSLTGRHGERPPRREGVETTAKNVIRYVSTLFQRSAFQACSFNHSDISPFRVNDLQAIGRQIIARRRPFRSVRHHP